MTAKDDKVTRAEFFSSAFKKSFQAALDLTETMVGPLDRLAILKENWQAIWNCEIPENQAKFVFFQGHPYFLLRVNGAIRTFSGLCPQDSNLVSIHPDGGFICSQCGSGFNPAETNQNYYLQEFKTKTEGEKIFIAL